MTSFFFFICYINFPSRFCREVVRHEKEKRWGQASRQKGRLLGAAGFVSLVLLLSWAPRRPLWGQAFFPLDAGFSRLVHLDH